jgi:hypothetical protein
LSHSGFHLKSVGEGASGTVFAVPGDLKKSVREAVKKNIAGSALSSEKDWVIKILPLGGFCHGDGKAAFHISDLKNVCGKLNPLPQGIENPMSLWTPNGPAKERLWDLVNRPIGFFVPSDPEATGSPRFVAMVLEKAGDMTALEYFKRQSIFFSLLTSEEQKAVQEKFYSDVRSALHEMEFRDMTHKDLQQHWGNIMVTLADDGKTLEHATVIDFGLTSDGCPVGWYKIQCDSLPWSWLVPALRPDSESTFSLLDSLKLAKTSNLAELTAWFTLILTGLTDSSPLVQEKALSTVGTLINEFGGSDTNLLIHALSDANSSFEFANEGDSSLKAAISVHRLIVEYHKSCNHTDRHSVSY